MTLRTLFLALALAAPLLAAADEPDPTREAVIAAMAAYGGESSAGIDRTTLAGKLICGYQGWFAAAGDGSGRGWRHYPHRGQFRPGSCTIDQIGRASWRGRV